MLIILNRNENTKNEKEKNFSNRQTESDELISDCTKAINHFVRMMMMMKND